MALKGMANQYPQMQVNKISDLSAVFFRQREEDRAVAEQAKDIEFYKLKISSGVMQAFLRPFRAGQVTLAHLTFDARSTCLNDKRLSPFSER
jgi:hypothetical protein